MNEYKTEPQTGDGPVFTFFNEVGIINQLSTAMLAQVLPDGVHPSHFAIVNHLFRVGNGWPPARIAAAMQVTKTTMSHSLKVLEDKGLIQIAPNPDDGRAKQVFLTDRGRVFRGQAILKAQKKFRDVLRPEDVEAMTRCLKDLQSVRRRLDEMRG